MGAATKSGMYCKRCNKPVAAQKTTHGVRNTAAVFTTVLVSKVEPWHCPDCGGPVVTSAQAKLSKQKTAKNETRRQRIVDTRREVGDGPVKIVVVALPKPHKKATAWSNLKTFRAVCEAKRASTSRSMKKRVQEELEKPPVSIRGLSGGKASKFVRTLREGGATVEVVPLESD